MSSRARTILVSVAGVIVALLLLARGLLFGMSPDFGGRLQADACPSGCASSTATPGRSSNCSRKCSASWSRRYYKEVDPAKLESRRDRRHGGRPRRSVHRLLRPRGVRRRSSRTLQQSYSGVGMTVELNEPAGHHRLDLQGQSGRILPASARATSSSPWTAPATDGHEPRRSGGARSRAPKAPR